MIDFSAPADVVAPQLLGATLTFNGVSIRLTEVEAYLGEDDEAAHTYNGQTPRNATMFGPPGRLYVYASYGIHRNGNIVCAPVGTGQGCLLRGGEVIEGTELAFRRRGTTDFHNLARGPGNLGKHWDSRWKITARQFNSPSVSKSRSGSAGRESASVRINKHLCAFGFLSTRPSRRAEACRRANEA